MRIGLDIMGGDHAPEAILQGASLSLSEISENVQIVLIGDRKIIEDHFKSRDTENERFGAIHVSEHIEMGENPATAFMQKKKSGIVRGMVMLRNGEIDAFASAGNTGAILVGAMQIIHSIPGVIRPCIAATLPSTRRFPVVFLDVGLNPDSRPDVLYQYGIMGSVYANTICGIPEPRVGLLNIGSEKEKGNLVAKAAYAIMEGTKEFNFIGNVEGNDFFSGSKVDVVVCDGFVGNILLKIFESIYDITVSRGIRDNYFEQFNYERFGGTPVLGINKPVLIGHGMSSPDAVKRMILHAVEVIELGLVDRIKEITKQWTN